MSSLVLHMDLIRIRTVVENDKFLLWTVSKRNKPLALTQSSDISTEIIEQVIMCTIPGPFKHLTSSHKTRTVVDVIL